MQTGQDNCVSVTRSDLLNIPGIERQRTKGFELMRHVSCEAGIDLVDEIEYLASAGRSSNNRQFNMKNQPIIISAAKVWIEMSWSAKLYY